MGLNSEIDLSGLKAAFSVVLDRPLILMAAGAIIIAIGTFMLFGGSVDQRDSEMALEQGKRAVSQLLAPVQDMQRTLRDEQVQNMAAMALEDENTQQDLQAYLHGRMQDLREVRLFEKEFITRSPESLGEEGYVILDMLLAAGRKGVAPVQLLGMGENAMVAGAATIADPANPAGYILALADAGVLLDHFDFSLPEAGYIALVQAAGGQTSTTLREFGTFKARGQLLTPLVVPGSLFRVAIPQAREASSVSGFERLMMFLLGGVLLAMGFIRRQAHLRRPVEFKPDPGAFPMVREEDGDEGDAEFQSEAADAAPAISDGRVPDTPGGELPVPEPEGEVEPEPEPAPGPEAPAGEVVLEDLTYESEQRRSHDRPHLLPVDLSAEIFRAYDIRGVVGETLDAGVARQVGQAVGSLALDRDATPVMVGRDGRHSGPELVDGMIEGLNAAGCDVIDVGAVPTGALYFAAHELGKGSGVMVTGSHNPPDYNGFKVMIGGDTLSGEAITGLYERIVSGDLRTGNGEVQGEEVLIAYRNRIAGDIQLQRPLKVVADCGNGIGGICAAVILRAIGAEVLPLYDDVNGDFPNHHPDPSEPENLEDLIDSVKLMKADIGVAFDGDADRLGVVTSIGDIIYSDRVMMLFAKEILGRHPGKTVIFDVKCTGHLAEVISAAGGVPEMWKTGHSLIKNRMKEIGAPFAGEMSGHFFFKDRWYGFDCGIYSACRLLEILAADPRDPEQVLADLPSSVSTPELKVHLQEGENHAFIERFQKEAEFPGASLSTIDGVRADFEGGWGLVRASNTTPVLVLRFDADDEATLRKVQEAFRGQLLAIKPDIELPF